MHDGHQPQRTPAARPPPGRPPAHVFPADASSMSLTCHWLPPPVTVTAYCVLLLLLPLVPVIFCTMRDDEREAATAERRAAR